jgi:hypothetical protein
MDLLRFALPMIEADHREAAKRGSWGCPDEHGQRGHQQAPRPPEVWGLSAPKIMAVGFDAGAPLPAGVRITTQAKTTASTTTASTSRAITIAWVVLERRRGSGRGAGGTDAGSGWGMA